MHSLQRAVRQRLMRFQLRRGRCSAAASPRGSYVAAGTLLRALRGARVGAPAPRTLCARTFATRACAVAAEGGVRRAGCSVRNRALR
jgi:hypothetical protein